MGLADAMDEFFLCLRMMSSEPVILADRPKILVCVDEIARWVLPRLPL